MQAGMEAFCCNHQSAGLQFCSPPLEQQGVGREGVRLGWHAQEDELAIGLQQGQQRGNLMLRGHCVNDGIKRTHSCLHSNHCRSFARLGRVPLGEHPLLHRHNDGVCASTKDAAKAQLSMLSAMACRRQVGRRVRTAICFSSLDTTKWFAPRFWRASFSLLGEVEMTVTSWPKPWWQRRAS